VIRPGSEWGTPTSDQPDATLVGDDRALADHLAGTGVGEAPGPLVRFLAEGSDFARAIGLRTVDPEPARPAQGIALPVDLIETDRGPAVNAVVLGPAPTGLRWWHRAPVTTVTVDGRELYAGPAPTVVVMNGQFLGTADVSPRGHPGDGRLEVQVYALRPGERGPMRARLASGTHVPHPRILTTSGREVTVRTTDPRPMARDGRPDGRVTELKLAVRPGAVRLLI
jgi:hypothetical protein